MNDATMGTASLNTPRTRGFDLDFDRLQDRFSALGFDLERDLVKAILPPNICPTTSVSFRGTKRQFWTAVEFLESWKFVLPRRRRNLHIDGACGS